MDIKTYQLLSISNEHIEWPEAVPIAEDRLIHGHPAGRTLIVQDDEKFQIGLWQISEGEFTTVHANYIEYIHIIRGEGELVDDNGVHTPLVPGTTVMIQPGWKGRWVVRQTIEKVYSVIYV